VSPQPAQSEGGFVRHVVTFGRILREAGLEVGPGRISDALTGLDCLDIRNRDDVYWTLRTTLVSRAEELESFDRAFAAWFLRLPSRPPYRGTLPVDKPPRLSERTRTDRTGNDDRPGDEVTEIGWSSHEVLRRKDFAAMTAEEFAQLSKAIAEVAASRPLRRSRRLRPHARGRSLDLRRLARRSLARGGDPIERTFRRRIEVPRKLVLLCDVSGSMEAYTRALLLFMHAAVGSGRGVEVFVFGTRLFRLTDEFKTRDPEEALAAAARRVVDWAAGTRIGASLKTFNDTWGRRALTRGAAVVIVSDGWEREDPALVAREMARLQRAAYAIVWVNPLKGNPEYQPLAEGMRAALPFVDRFVAGHNLTSLEELAGILAGIERRHAA
jgi:uncharacterized protein with von Willebrand factor type A (vWA) domain